MRHQSETYLGSHTNLAEADESPRASISRNGTGRQDGDEDDGIHNVRQRIELSFAVGDDERRRVGTGGTEEVRVARRHGDGDDERAHDIEEGKSDPHGAHSTRNGLARVGGLGSNEACVLGSGHGENARRHNGKESLEAVGEAAGGVPVLEADGLVVWRAAS